MNPSWAEIGRWELSHTWKTYRSHPGRRECKACGDYQDSPVRRCPGQVAR